MAELLIDHPQLGQLYDYWRSKRNAQRYPLRGQIDPAELKFCLSHLALAEVEEAPFRVRYRLVGLELCALYGADLTGRYVDEVYSPLFRARVQAVYRTVVESGEPHYDAPFFGVARFRLGYHRLLLPLSMTGQRVDRVLVGIYPADGRITRAAEWRNQPEVREWLVEEALDPFLHRKLPGA